LVNREPKIHLERKPLGFLGTFLVGMAFGAGWTPCVGSILGAILTMAATTQNILKGITASFCLFDRIGATVLVSRDSNPQIL